MTGVHSHPYGGGDGSGGEEELFVHLVGGGPYGMRFDRLGTSGPVFVAKMHKRSKAMAAGVQIGDVMLSINNFDCRRVTSDHVTEFINRSSATGQPIVLRLNRGNPHHRQLLQQHQHLKDNSRLVDGNQSRQFQEADNLRQQSAKTVFNSHHSYNHHYQQHHHQQPPQQPLCPHQLPHQPFETYADIDSVAAPPYSRGSQLVRQFSQLSTTVVSTPTSNPTTKTSYWSDAERGGTQRVWIDEDGDNFVSRQPRQRHVSAVLIPTGEQHPEWWARGDGVSGSNVGAPQLPSLSSRATTVERFDRQLVSGSHQLDSALSINSDRQPLPPGPSSWSSTLPLPRPHQQPVSSASRTPIHTPLTGSQSSWNPTIWRPLSSSTENDPKNRPPNQASHLTNAANDKLSTSAFPGDRCSTPKFNAVNDVSRSTSFDKRYDFQDERDWNSSLKLSTSLIEQRPSAGPLETDRLRPPTSSLFVAAGKSQREADECDVDHHLDTEVIIWSSKIGDSGVGLNRLEPPRRRPYSVAAFPIKNNWKDHLTTGSGFEETTVTSQAAVSLKPPVSIPLSLPVPPADEVRRPTGVASSYNEHRHQKCLPSGEDELQPMNGNGTAGFRGYDPIQSLGRQPPIRTSDRVDHSSNDRRHSAQPVPQTAVNHWNGNGATTSDLFLSRSGIVTGSENDVIESSKRKKLYGDSAFYEDSNQKYPTIEEQIKLARKVAQLLTSSSNAVSGRGQQMFLKRQQQSDKWATESTAGQPFYGSSKSRLNTSGLSLPPPSSHVTELAELERLRTQAEKTRHNTLPPILGNQIAVELHRAATTGRTTAGRMFAQRIARADKYVVPEAVVHRRPEPLATPPPPARPEVVAAMRRSVSQPEVREQPLEAMPVPRLKQMIDMPRAAMTPWEAASKFDGRVDPAFEHLSAFRQSTQVAWSTLDDADYDDHCRADGHETGGGVFDIDARSATGQQHPTDSEVLWIDQHKQTNSWRNADAHRPLPSRARSACFFDQPPTPQRLPPSTMTASAAAPASAGSGYGQQYHVTLMANNGATDGRSLNSISANNWSRATTPANWSSSQLDLASVRPSQAGAASGNAYRPMKFRIPA